jgi:hypothetical protein
MIRKIHDVRCLGYLCTCGLVVQANFSELEHEESFGHDDDCACSDCREALDAALEREFDEKIALGYFI